MFAKKFAGYTSEITNFIDELKSSRPAIEKNQLAGRALLWDKEPIDLDSTERLRQSKISQQSYVYQPD